MIWAIAISFYVLPPYSILDQPLMTWKTTLMFSHKIMIAPPEIMHFYFALNFSNPTSQFLGEGFPISAVCLHNVITTMAY